jgi:predicted transcriptional regulator
MGIKGLVPPINFFRRIVMTIKEIAGLCGVDETTIARWIRGERFLNCKMQLRNSVIEKLDHGSPERPSDYDLEETLAIIGEGGENKALAALLAENAANKNALAIQGATGGAAQIAAFSGLMERVAKLLDDPQKAQNEELERFVRDNMEYDEKHISVSTVRLLHHGYEKIAEKPFSEREFMLKIALKHPEFTLRYQRKEWYFLHCHTKHFL